MPVEIPNPELFKPFKPTAPSHHALFGTKYFRVHRFKCEKWQPSEKTLQFKTVSNILRKNLDYKLLELTAKRKKDRAKLNLLRQECHDGRLKIKKAIEGDVQNVRNIVTGHVHLQRLYSKLNSYAILENANQNTFAKRKENDRLRYKLKVLSKQYSNCLLEESKLQDRIKYQNEFMLKSELDSEYCRKILTNQLTRLKAQKLITSAYRSILGTLTQDERFYEPILDELVRDIEEQTNFIDHIILIGVPAIKENEKLTNDFAREESQTLENLRKNLEFILQSKKKIKTETDNIVKIVRRNFTRIPNLHDYIRETISMERLIEKSDKMEAKMKKVKFELSCPIVKNILPSLRKARISTEKQGKRLVREQFYFDTVEDTEIRSEAVISKFENNVTNEYLKKLQTISECKKSLHDEKIKQQQYIDDVKERGLIYNEMKKNLLHLQDVVRHIKPIFSENYKITIPVLKYPNEELKLPLLNFDAKPRVSEPPDISHSELEAIFAEVILRIQKLADTRLGTDLPLDEAVITFGELYVRIVEEQNVLKDQKEEKTEESVTLYAEREDPNILSNKSIKAWSVKIIEDVMRKREESGLM